MGQFEDAVRQLRQSELICPFCGEANRPQAPHLIKLEADGKAVCDVCGRDWTPKDV